MIACSCPECGYEYKVADDLAGTSVLCPDCKTRFPVKGKPQRPARRDEDDEGDREMPAKGGGIPVWAWVVGGATIALVILVGIVVVAMTVVGTAPVAQNAAPPAAENAPPAKGEQQPAPNTPPAQKPPATEPGLLELNQWYKFGKEGDVSVWVEAVWFDFVPLEGVDGPAKSSEKQVMVKVHLRNTSDTRKVDYRGWQTRFALATWGAHLDDDLHNTYKAISYGIHDIIGHVQGSTSIFPGKDLTDLLVFERTVPAASYLVLTLPG
jgi:hypothetical protein